MDKILLRTSKIWASNATLSYRALANVTLPRTVDPHEIENLEAMSENWWDPFGPSKALHSMNMLRVSLVRDGLISTGIVDKANINLPSVLQNVNILEVGCGGGILSEALARLHSCVVGIDPSKKLINTAREHAAKDSSIANRIRYEAQVIEEHSQSNSEKYDAVIASEVIEHIKDKMLFFEHCLRVLKPGGSIFITTINKTPLSWFAAIIAAENVLGLVPKNTHDYEKFVSPLDVQRILKTYNCNTILVHGMLYEFWCNRWKWISRTDVNYALQAVKNE